METESQWWKGQLAADIHQALRIKELKLPVYHAHSPQIGMRRYFADLLAILSNRYQLCATARHLAVYLLDLFMDHYDVAIKQLYVIALSCLLLASKFEEKEDRVPKLEQLNSLGIMCSLNLVLNKRDLIKMELLLLETFNWNLCIPTPAHFIDYYLQASVQEGDLYNSWPLTSLSKTKAFMDKYTHYFLEVSLQDHAFLSFRPSQVAAACVAASRICLQITPSWTTALHLLTGYTWDHLTKCIELMLLAHDNDVKEANKSKSPHPSSQVSLQPVAQHMHLSPVSAVQRPTLTPSSLSSSSSSSSSVSSASQPLLFQARDYPHLSQHSPSLAQLHALAAAAASAEPQALGAMVPQDFLHSHSRMAMLPGSEMAAALPSYQSLPAGLQTGPRTLALQGPISMQVAIAAEPPRHCMSVAAYAAGGYLGAHPTFSAGCFNR